MEKIEMCSNLKSNKLKGKTKNRRIVLPWLRVAGMKLPATFMVVENRIQCSSSSSSGSIVIVE